MLGDSGGKNPEQVLPLEEEGHHTKLKNKNPSGPFDPTSAGFERLFGYFDEESRHLKLANATK